MTDTLRIDGSGPLPVQRASSVADVQAAVRDAAASGAGVYPVGGRTMLDLGMPPTKPGVALDLTGLNRVIDYPARDMTVTVEAGVTIAALREVLKQEGQWLPIDVPNPERATVGGVIAANVSGPRRLGYGTIRDYLIGIHFVADTGDEVKAGGRVVKNVAGYDLMKTHTGALGTLGVITAATFKVTPIPRAIAAILLFVKPANLATVLDTLHGSKSRPCAVEICNSSAGYQYSGVSADDVGYFVSAFYEGGEEAVRWQFETARYEFPDSEDISHTASSSLSFLADCQTLPHSKIISKCSVRPSGLAAALNKMPIDHILFAHGLTGVIWCHSHSSLHPGFVARRLDPAKKTALNVFGPAGSDRAVMAELKAALDPKGLFNPGRGPVG